MYGITDADRAALPFAEVWADYLERRPERATGGELVSMSLNDFSQMAELIAIARENQTCAIGPIVPVAPAADTPASTWLWWQQGDRPVGPAVMVDVIYADGTSDVAVTAGQRNWNRAADYPRRVVLWRQSRSPEYGNGEVSHPSDFESAITDEGGGALENGSDAEAA